MQQDEIVESARELMSAFHRFKSLHHPGGFMPGMHNAEFFMLHSVDQASQDSACGDGIKISELSKLNRISMPAISQAINSLESKGLVERRPGKDDRRVVCVHITEAGKQFLRDRYTCFMKYVSKVVKRMGEEDARDLARLFNKLLDVITEIQKEGNTI